MPSQPIIRGGEANFNQSFDVDADNGRAAKSLGELVGKRQAAKKSYYQSQVDEMNNLDTLLKTTDVKDFADMQKSIAGARDEIKQLYMDNNFKGHNTPEFQQKLYEIKFAVDQALAQCPEYSLEQDWLEEQHVNRAMEKLQNGKKT